MSDNEDSLASNHSDVSDEPVSPHVTQHSHDEMEGRNSGTHHLGHLDHSLPHLSGSTDVHAESRGFFPPSHLMPINMDDHHDKHLLEHLDVFSGQGYPNQFLSHPHHDIPSISETHEESAPTIPPLRTMASLNSPNSMSAGNSSAFSQPSKAVNVVTSLEGRTQKVSTTAVNLFKVGATMANKHDIIPSLSKPAFCPTDSSWFVCGTEEQDPSKKNSNFLIFSQLRLENTEPKVKVEVKYTYAIADYVRDMHWVDTNILVVALNSKLGLLRLSPERTVDELVMFPEFHRDSIREIAVSHGNKSLVISGGFDGNVFVTDISRLVTDIQKNSKKSENSLYPCKDVVGSVAWHPEDGFLASCTTDTGTLHIFDVRTDRRRPAIVYDAARRELYTHSYQNNVTMLLGFGDGAVQVFDIRYKRELLTFMDPHVKQIGDIKFDPVTKHFANFGVPQFSLWNFEENSMFNLCAHQPLVDLNTVNAMVSSNNLYKTAGDFIRGTKALGVTDSLGTFAVFEFGN